MPNVRLSDEVHQSLKSIQGYLQMQDGRTRSLSEVVDILIHYFIINESRKGNIIMVEIEKTKKKS